MASRERKYASIEEIEEAHQSPDEEESAGDRKRRKNRLSSALYRFRQRSAQVDGNERVGGNVQVRGSNGSPRSLIAQLLSAEVAPPAVTAPVHVREARHDPSTDHLELQAITGPEELQRQRCERQAEQARRRRTAMSTSQQERTWARDRERARARRANLTSSQRDRTRRIDTERQRARRAQQSERDRDRADQEERRASQTEEERERVRERNRVGRERQREEESQEEREARQERNRVLQLSHRSRLSQEEREERRWQDRLRHQESRTLIPPDERAHQERLRRSGARRGHALHNDEDFDASMVTGSDVVDGRHRLPPTTVCDHCNAWNGQQRQINSAVLKEPSNFQLFRPRQPACYSCIKTLSFANTSVRTTRR
ncbi:hypothetical protein PI126_g21823 [Phytophthora idaei]|nr:hypothetical protein PI126_g21823 [Phytophthora idaei]